MKEISEILERVSTLENGERAVLATVVDLQGSGYRRPGARMLIEAGGGTSGTVSGGCLEADVLERAKRVLESDRAEVFTYDTTADETSVFSLNMGCRGVIRILLESVGRDHPLLAKFEFVRETRDPYVAGTLISQKCAEDYPIGGRVFFGCEEPLEYYDLPPGIDFSTELERECRDFLKSQETSRLFIAERPQGRFEFAFEMIEPEIKVLVFGAGNDAIPLVELISDIGWEPHVYDNRPAYLTEKRFPSASALILRSDDQPAGTLYFDNRTAVAVMTHNYGRDLEALPVLLRSHAFYIGMLGPKRRTEQLLGELAAAGEIFTPEQLSRLYAPVGLDIGADTPEAIAMSIAAEIQSVLSRRVGGHLRDRQGSIYDRK